MEIGNFVITEGLASSVEILEHLSECDSAFFPPLSKTVDIAEYSLKIHASAIRFEVWHCNRLIGLLAAYFNDFESWSGFISNVSISPKFQGLTLASRLMHECKSYAMRNNFKKIFLKVNSDNIKAINLYSRHGYVAETILVHKITMKLDLENHFKKDHLFHET